MRSSPFSVARRSSPDPTSRRWPTSSGALLVFCWQMRRRNAWQDLLWAGILLLATLVSAVTLQTFWTQESPYAGPPPVLLRRWLLTATIGAVLIFLPCAAILGAYAVPAREEFEVTQSALLARLTPFDLCAGRMLAGLWPLVSATLASCALWLTAELIWRSAVETGSGYGAILATHIVLLCALFMTGSISFLFAQRRRPGRHWGRGATAGVLWATFCLSALFLFDGAIRRLSQPRVLIESALLLNPAAAVATALQADLLRTPLLYERSAAPWYRFTYPGPWRTSLLYLGIGMTALVLAAGWMRRAYR
ncbi:MAG: hypothetical protein RMJ43_07290 [Chloroherpetonaceae bacterium]|nr:hypothetical protein [Chthonomonadaceae bacterium]MDW8207625.1 hypothetical protein [Chloroherpetonaceae bacterium]